MAELKFSIGVDDSKVEQAVQRMRQQFETISRNAVTSGKSIDEAFKRAAKLANEGADEFASLGEQIEFQKQIIKDLEGEVSILGKELKLMSSGKEFDKVSEELENVKKELIGEYEGLRELQKQADLTDQAHASLKKQMQDVREQMQALEIAGKRDTKEYENLKNKAVELKKSMNDFNLQMKSLASNQSAFQGIISGLSGVSGAISAAMGVMGMFTDENEKMQKVMLRVQSLMSITVGLQQLQATLYKDSAFRLVTLNGLKEWWAKVTAQAAAAQELENAAVVKGGVAAKGAAGGFKLLGAAIKSIPGIGWLLTALSALAVILKKDFDKHKEIKKQMTEEVESARELTKEARLQQKIYDDMANVRKSAIDSTSGQITKLKIAVESIKNLNSNTDGYKRAMKDISDIIGVQIDKLGLEKQKVIEITDAWVGLKVAEAEAEGYIGKIGELNSKFIDIQNAIFTPSGYPKKSADEFKEFLESLGLLSTNDINDITRLYATNDKRIYQRLKEIEQAVNSTKESYTAMYRSAIEAQQAAQSTISSIAPQNNGLKMEYEQLKKDSEKYGKELTDTQVKLEREAEQARIDAMDEGFEKERAQLKLNHELKIKEYKDLEAQFLKDAQEEAKRQAKLNGGQYVEENVKISPELKSLIESLIASENQIFENLSNNINKRETESIIEPFKNVLNEFPTILQRWHDIEKKYADKRKALYDEDGKLRIGVTKETLDNIDKAEKEEMRRMFSEINSDNTGFKNFLDTLENYTLRQLETMIEKVREKFEELSSDPDADVKITAQYGELLYVLEELIEKKEQFIDLSFAGNSEELKKLTSAARELADVLGFDSETQEFLNNMLDVFEMVADIATEISNTFQDIANIASDVSDEVADTTSSIADSRDWITMVIKLVIKLVSWIVKATDKVKQTKELLNNTLTEHIEPALSNIDLSLSNIDLYSNIGDVQQAVYSLIWTLDELRGTYNSMSGSGKDAALDMELLHDKVLYLSKSILDLYHSGKMLGSSDPYENQINSLNNYSYQIQVLTAKLNIYRNVLANISESDKNAEERANLQQTISQIEGEIASAISSSFNTITDIIEGKLGTSFDSMAEQLADALWDAFDSGADAAQAWADTVDDIIKNMTRKLIMESIILNPLKEILNRLTGNWVTVDNEGRYHIDQEAINSSLPSLQQELMGLYEQVITAYEGLDDVLKGLAQFGNDATETTSKGIAQASQESIDELNGRLTVIQAHTAQLLENSGLMRLDVASIRSIVGNISGDTAHMRTKIDDIAHSLDVVLTRI
jgi:DNA repair exonuclease SbcCD ATPase subunit